MVAEHWYLAPETAGHAVDELIGTPAGDDVSVTNLAMEVIESGPNLHLTLQQWGIVQGLVEAGIRTGMARRG